MTYQAAFDNFMSNDDEVREAILLATKQGWGGNSTATVELFDDGTYRLLDRGAGNLYNSRGILVGIPELQESDYNEEDNDLSYFDDAMDRLREGFQWASQED